MKTFEQWMAEMTFPDGTMPVSAREKYLMRLAYEANKKPSVWLDPPNVVKGPAPDELPDLVPRKK